MVATSEHAPGFLFLCYPTFLAPNDSCCTVSNGAFRKYAGFERILLDTWRSAQFTHRSGQNFSLPFKTINSIDYISLNVHTTTPASRRDEYTKSLQFQALALQPVAITHPTMKSTWVQSWALHIAYGHRSLGSLQQMVDKGWIRDSVVSTKIGSITFLLSYF